MTREARGSEASPQITNGAYASRGEAECRPSAPRYRQIVSCARRTNISY